MVSKYSPRHGSQVELKNSLSLFKKFNSPMGSLQTESVLSATKGEIYFVAQVVALAQDVALLQPQPSPQHLVHR